MLNMFFPLILILLYLNATFSQSQSNWCSSCDDPHITTFDSLDYEFHEFGQHYILYTDFDNTLVTAGYMPCAEDSTLSCNCAVYVKFRDTVLFMDMCGVSSVDQDLNFYYSIKGRFRAYTAACDAKLVDPVDETNNAWWNKPGNAVSINTRLLCAKMANTDTYVIRTNNLNPDSNIFVRVIAHPLGISCVFIKPSPRSYGNTGGICGLWNGNDADDGYIIGSNRKKVFLDLPYDTESVTKMGLFWRLTKFATTSQRYKLFEVDLYCPCDRPQDEIYDTDVPYWLLQESGRFCHKLTSQCVSKTANYVPRIQSAVRRVRAIESSQETAEEVCKKNILQADIKQCADAKMVDIDPIMNHCVHDFKHTNDMYWSMTQANVARNLALINIEQAKKIYSNTQYLRIGHLNMDIFTSVIQNATLFQSLTRSINERFPNFEEILNYTTTELTGLF